MRHYFKVRLVCGGLVVGVAFAGLSGCSSESLVTSALEHPRLTSGGILSGEVTVTDSTFGESRSLLQHRSTTEVFAVSATNSKFSVVLPGTTARIVIGTTTSTSSANASMNSFDQFLPKEHEQTVLDSIGRRHTIAVTSLGAKGPKSRLRHMMGGKLVASIDYDWIRVDGGWLLQSETVASYRDGKEASRTTISIATKTEIVARVQEIGRRVVFAMFTLVSPAPLHAAGFSTSASMVDESNCFWKGLVLVGAGVAVGLDCLAGGPFNPGCWLAMGLFLAAADDYNSNCGGET